MITCHFFMHGEFGNLRAYTIGGQIWFAAEDVCNALEMPVKESLFRIEEDEQTYVNGEEIGEEDEPFILVNETGLYYLAFLSVRLGTKEYKRWVRDEVIPTMQRQLVINDLDRALKALQSGDTEDNVDIPF